MTYQIIFSHTLLPKTYEEAIIDSDNIIDACTKAENMCPECYRLTDVIEVLTDRDLDIVSS